MISAKRYKVFFDFDNTITIRDVIDDMMLRFSKDKHWIDLERKWKQGKIGSKECLQGQIRGIRITQKVLERYLNKVRLDPYFKKLKRLLDSRRIKVVVLSDNFSYILKQIFANNKIRNLKIYSNRVKLTKDRLLLNFPFTNKKCPLCGHCKKKNLLANVNKDSVIIYIGDGQSDICPAKYADIVFAKGELLRYFKEKKLHCLPFETLKDVHSYFVKNLV
jgi:2,3-diketo-5-methylthio-1-phosphopentane phosphatase